MFQKETWESHDSLKKINVILDKDSGEPRLSHKIVYLQACIKSRNPKRKQKKIIKLCLVGKF